MNELLNHINNSQWVGLFDPREGSHIIPHTYNIIKAAARDQADTLVLTSTEFKWSKEGQVLGQFPTSQPAPPTYSFYKALKEIINRDKFVSNFLKVVSEKENEVICELLLDG